MLYPLLIPKSKAVRQIRDGGGKDFWDSFWNEFSNAQVYAERKASLTHDLSMLEAVDLPSNRKIYAEITLEQEANAKTKRPSDLWKRSNLDVVEYKDEHTLTVSGTKRDFDRLREFIRESSFESAKNAESKTKKNLSRQLFAVSLFRGKNTGIEKRIDRRILQSITQRLPGIIECIIEIYPDQKTAEYDDIYRKILSSVPNIVLKKRNTDIFVHNMSFFASLTIGQIVALLDNIEMNFVQKIRMQPQYFAQRCIPRESFSDVTINDPVTDEIVCVFDSGINHPTLNGQRFSHQNFVSGKTEDKNHGTFVTSRILFGKEIFSRLSASPRVLTPSAKFLDVQVLFSGHAGEPMAISEIQEAILQIVKRYKDSITIYNFSICNDQPIEEEIIDDLTEFLDTICRQFDLIFICSAGNHDRYVTATDYEEIFSNPSLGTEIASPADALNVITVGSISNSVIHDCICVKENHPSPFTRKGGSRNDIKKPDLVFEGGNVQRDPSGIYAPAFMQASRNNLGVEGIDTIGLNKDCGTSFSTPLATWHALHLLDYIKKSNLRDRLMLDGNRANLVKALLIHSTCKNQQALITDENVKRAYGFGIPDYEKVLNDNENSVSVVYSDQIGYSERKHKLHIHVPEALRSLPLELSFSLVFNPPVDKNYASQYNMIWLAPSIRQVRPVINPTTGEIKFDAKSLNPASSWDNYRNQRSSVSHFKKKLRRGLDFPIIEILITMNIFEEYEKVFHGSEEENIFQNYAFVLTIKDQSESSRLREELVITNQFEVLTQSTVVVPLT